MFAFACIACYVAIILLAVPRAAAYDLFRSVHVLLPPRYFILTNDGIHGPYLTKNDLHDHDQLEVSSLKSWRVADGANGVSTVYYVPDAEHEVRVRDAPQCP